MLVTNRSMNNARAQRAARIVEQHRKKIETFLWGFTLLSVEELHVSDNLRAIDRNAGIDYLLIDKQGDAYTLAMRVQRAHKQERNFSIRYYTSKYHETEYQKRVRQIEKGCTYPHYTMQVLHKKGVICAMAVTRTDALYAYLQSNFEACKANGYQYPNKVKPDEQFARFACVSWREYEKAGNPIQIYLQ